MGKVYAVWVDCVGWSEFESLHETMESIISFYGNLSKL